MKCAHRIVRILYSQTILHLDLYGPPLMGDTLIEGRKNHWRQFSAQEP